MGRKVVKIDTERERVLLNNDGAIPNIISQFCREKVVGVRTLIWTRRFVKIDSISDTKFFHKGSVEKKVKASDA